MAKASSITKFFQPKAKPISNNDDFDGDTIAVARPNEDLSGKEVEPRSNVESKPPSGRSAQRPPRGTPKHHARAIEGPTEIRRSERHNAANRTSVQGAERGVKKEEDEHPEQCEPFAPSNAVVSNSAEAVLDTPASPMSSTESLPSLSDLEPPANQRCMEPPKAASSTNKHQLNASFGSISTLSTLPASSQISQTSSRRVIENGVPAVTNSSSEQDSFDESSDSDELDIEDLIARKRQKLSEQSDTSNGIPTPASADRRLRTSTTTTSRSKRAAPRSPPKQLYKHGLAAMMRQQRKDAELNDRLDALESSISAPTTQGTAPEALNTAFADDEDADQRLKLAFKRMEALDKEVQFNFFEIANSPDPERHDFPVECLPDTKWANLMKTASSRNHMLISGLGSDLARTTTLPEEILEWMLSEMFCEKRDDLPYAYVDILSSHMKHHDDSSLLDMSMLQDCISRLGARDDIVDQCDQDKQSTLTVKGLRTPRAGRRGLPSFLALLRKSSAQLSQSVREAGFYFLALMLIDDNIMGDGDLTLQLQNTVIELVLPIEENQVEELAQSCSRLFLRDITHPVLINRLLLSLPPFHTRLASIRRRLAFSFMTSSKLPDVSIFTSQTAWRAINTHITSSPHFQLTDASDYAVVAARVSIIDIAVGPGFSDFSFLDQPSAPSNPLPPNILTSDAASHSAPSIRAIPQANPKAVVPEAERSFNAHVDALSALLRQLSSHIRDAGAAHMKRTECKGAIDRLVVRLDFAVRTRSKPKRAVFGTGEARSGESSTEGIMGRFLKREELRQGRGEDD